MLISYCYLSQVLEYQLLDSSYKKTAVKVLYKAGVILFH